MKQLTDQVYQFPFNFQLSNIYLIDTPDGLVLIDTGTTEKPMKAVVHELQKRGRLEDLKHIFITHAHFDHVGGLNYLQNYLPPTIRIYAHRREAAIIRHEAPVIYARREDLRGFYWLTSFLTPFITKDPVVPSRVDTEVKEGDRVGDILQVIDLPGHTYGQIGLWWQERGILFGGDVMMRMPWGLTRPFAAASPDPVAVIASIQKVASLKLNMLCICHGAPLTQNTASTIQAFADRLKA